MTVMAQWIGIREGRAIAALWEMPKGFSYEGPDSLPQEAWECLREKVARQVEAWEGPCVLLDKSPKEWLLKHGRVTLLDIGPQEAFRQPELEGLERMGK